jgi:GrpB-like predicted nucleotidyltransferase (UPF0157 family)
MTDVNLVPYSENWPRQFAHIHAALAAVFEQQAVHVMHIGSTAIPNLVAKPVIDVLLGATSLFVIEEKISCLEALGYRYISKYEHEIPMRRYFVKAADALPRIHLHCVVLNSVLWQDHISFRDALLSDSALVAQYQTLKMELAAKFAHDKAGYTLAKATFIKAVIRGAQAKDN